MDRSKSDTQRLLELSIERLDRLATLRRLQKEIEQLQHSVDAIDSEAREIRANPTQEAA